MNISHIKKNSRWLLYLLTGYLLAACSAMQDDIDGCPSDGGITTNYTVTFSIPAVKELTRNFSGQEAGQNMESYIDTKKVAVYLFTGDRPDPASDMCLEKVGELAVEHKEASSYTVKGKLAQMYEQPVKIVVFANILPDDITPGTTIAEACQKASSVYLLQQGNTNVFAPSESTPVPMFGIQSYSADEWKKGWSEVIDGKSTNSAGLSKPIHLIRSVAKIRVRCSAENYKLSSVTLNRYNDRGYAAPTGMYNHTFLLDEANGLFDEKTGSDYINIPNTAQTNEPLVQTTGRTENIEWLSGAEKTRDNCFVLYVPEYKNTDISADKEAKLTITLQKKVGEGWQDIQLEGHNTIWFKTYLEGKPTSEAFDILRNHIYDFEVRSVSGNLELASRILPWYNGGEYNYVSEVETCLTVNKSESNYYFEKDVEDGKALAIAYRDDASQHPLSPELNLQVKSAEQWILQTDNPYFGFRIKNADGTWSDVRPTITGTNMNLTFCIVPLKVYEEVTDTKHDVKVSLVQVVGNNSNHVPFNVDSSTGKNLLPGNKDYIHFIQIPRTDFPTSADE